MPTLPLPFSFSDRLVSARRSMAIFQHHDGITGTATPEVVQDYGKMLFTALQDMEVSQEHD